MTDDLQQIAQQAATGGAIGGIAGLLRNIIFKQTGGPLEWLSSTAGGLIVGVLLWLVLADTRAWDFNPPQGVKVAAVIAAAMIARDLLTGLGSLGGEFAKNPIGLVRSLWDALRGK